MRRDRVAGLAALVAVVMTTAVAAWGFAVDRDAPGRWFFIATFPPALWAFVEYAQVRGGNAPAGRAIMTVHRCCIAWLGLLLGTRAGMGLAIHADLLDAVWLDAGRRFTGVILGVGMILFGNYLPTLRSPWSLLEQPFAWQHVHRFVGWVFVLAGLGVLACWMMLDTVSASRATVRIMAATVILGLGRKLASLIAHSSPRISA
jgi:hypothetical protein